MTQHLQILSWSIYKKSSRSSCLTNKTCVRYDLALVSFGPIQKTLRYQYLKDKKGKQITRNLRLDQIIKS